MTINNIYFLESILEWSRLHIGTEVRYEVKWPKHIMAGRGRGRSYSFDTGALGFGKGDAIPAAILQPPPLFPVSMILLVLHHFCSIQGPATCIASTRVKLHQTGNFASCADKFTLKI